MVNGILFSLGTTSRTHPDYSKFDTIFDFDIILFYFEGNIEILGSDEHAFFFFRRAIDDILVSEGSRSLGNWQWTNSRPNFMHLIVLFSFVVKRDNANVERHPLFSICRFLIDWHSSSLDSNSVNLPKSDGFHLLTWCD